MSSPSFASTVTISPSGFLKCRVILCTGPDQHNVAPARFMMSVRTPRRALVVLCRRAKPLILPVEEKLRKSARLAAVQQRSRFKARRTRTTRE